MIALSVAKLNFFSPDSDISLWIKAKKKKKLFVESLDQFRRLEVREKARNVFVMSLRLSDHKVLHNIVSSLSFFDFARIFSLFSLVFRTSKVLMIWYDMIFYYLCTVKSSAKITNNAKI